MSSACAGARRSASNTATPTPARSTSSGSSANSTAGSTGSRPKDDSYRSPAWEPCLPVNLPPFLTGLLTRQIRHHKHSPCGCAAQHGGSGRYVFLGPDGGHYRRSNYARRIFRPACDGRHEAKDGRPPKLVIADATTWPGVPIAAWPPADPCSIAMAVNVLVREPTRNTVSSVTGVPEAMSASPCPWKE